MKRRVRAITSILLALVSLFCLAVPSFAATRNQQKQSAYGFLEYVGCEEGMEDLKNDPDTQLGKPGDATSFENMLLALDMLDASNRYRTQEGVPELKINYTLFANAMMNANWASQTRQHRGQIFGGEVLAFNTASPQSASAMWYAEKQTYLAHPDWAHGTEEQQQQVGHYLNLVNPKYAITGGGVCSRDGYTWCQIFRKSTQYAQMTLDAEPSYTVSQVRQKLKDYISQVGYYDENDTSPETPFRQFDDETPVGTAQGNEWYCMKSDLKLPDDTIDIVLTHISYDESGNLILNVVLRNGTNHDDLYKGIHYIDIRSRAESNKPLVTYSKDIPLSQPVTVPPKSSREFTVSLSPSQQLAHGDLTKGVDASIIAIYT